MAAELGTTSDPKSLVPGSPAAIYATEAELRSYGDHLHQAGAGLQRIDTVDGWRGDAGDAFRHAFHGQPGKWLQAGDAFHDAADALKSYVSTLVWAQAQAATAVSQWNSGDKAAAGETLRGAREQLSSAGDSAASKVGKARDLAPPKPGFWSRLGDDIGGFFSDAGHFVEKAGEVVLGDLASVGNAMVHDPGAVLQLAGGLGLAVLGAGGEIGGFALDVTGIGAVLGVPVNVISAVAITGGLGMAGVGLNTIMHDAAGPDRVNMNSDGGGGGGGGDTGGEPVSNRVRPPREGDTNYVVDNPSDLSDTITDIDRVENGTLWEEKTATGQDPRMDPQKWVQKNVVKKLDSYIRARPYLEGYENAPLGMDFTEPGATPQFRAAVEQAVEDWKAANPGVDVSVRWAQ
ncbi:WXG100 family type VII secretion target [Kitasatospora sp. NPDC086801]|uniref:WXG100 family type VII secretion target n=1 Tax=Kitasatospora sp. NPDC086801 TaxID=3364066 RepID=UPI0037FF51D3